MNSQNTPAPWLKTDRLSLREFAVADRDALVTMHKDPRVRALLVDDHPLDRHVVAQELIIGLQALYRQHEGLGIWCAEHMVSTLNKADLLPEERDELSPSILEELTQPRPRFAGWFNLMPMAEQPDELELGSRLLPKVWGTGMALEGGEQLLQHAFNTLGRDRVWAVSHIKHRSVRYCVSVLGFSEDGIRLYEGKPAQYYVINQSNWRKWMTISRKKRQRHAIRLYQGLNYKSF